MVSVSKYIQILVVCFNFRFYVTILWISSKILYQHNFTSFVTTDSFKFMASCSIIFSSPHIHSPSFPSYLSLPHEYIYIYVIYICVYIYIYIYIYIYKLLSPLRLIIYMYFSLTTWNYMIYLGLFLEKIELLSLRTLWLFLALHIGVMSCETSSIQIIKLDGIFLVAPPILFVLTWRKRWVLRKK